jgi:hypothetical protein
MESIVIAAAALACPVGMGLMMWFMGKGMRGKPGDADAKLFDVDGLREEYRRLGEEIERLETDRVPVPR